MGPGRFMKNTQFVTRWRAAIVCCSISGLAVSGLGLLSAGALAQGTKGLDASSPHPALLECQKRFRSMSITVGVPFAAATMLELCSTVQAACTAETDRGRDCQNAIADVDSNLASSFGISEKKTNKAR